MVPAGAQQIRTWLRSVGVVRRFGYKSLCWDRLKLPILGLILMGLFGYIWNRTRQRMLLRIRHDIPQRDEFRDDDEHRDADTWLEDRLREEIRRYEDDLRELAKT